MRHASYGKTASIIVGLMVVWIVRAMAMDSPTWDVVFIAHRGGIVPGYPENTIAAFRNAIEHGADAIEMDLRSTKDGEVVIIHDTTLDRTTTGRGNVIEHTLGEVKKLDAGHGERVPTYEEVLRLVAGRSVQLVLDIDEQPLDTRKVVQLTARYRSTLRVIAGVRRLEDLQTFQTLDPSIRTVGFVQDIASIEPFVLAGVDIVRVRPEWIHQDPNLTEKLHKAGKPVWTTAGDAPREELKRLMDLGVNGIISDRPELMNALLGEMRKIGGLNGPRLTPAR
jgi:glycerophosphoryl diester phosphodiesterase